jgi:hypothetical protein
MRPTPDPFLLFVNSNAAHYAACILGTHAERREPLRWPQFYCEGMAIELFVKCLLAFRGVSFWGHRIHELYLQAPVADRNRVSELYDQIVRGHPYFASAAARGIALDIEAVLERADRFGVVGRYWNEDEPFNLAEAGFAGNPWLSALCDAIREHLFECNPQWRTALRAYKSPSLS